jgi:hypothetical protein
VPVAPCNGATARLARRDLGILLADMSELVEERGLKQGQNRRVGGH